MWIRIGEGHNMYWKHCRWFEYNKRKGIDHRQEALEYYFLIILFNIIYFYY